jgi:hypothetical protein
MTELRIAEAEYEAARAEALHRGQIATQPLTAQRLGELCALGERMMRAGWRKEHALERARQFPV